jgi:hemerythrin-like domain-containing protein
LFHGASSWKSLGRRDIMKPIGPLMWEHRLIEQIVPLMKNEIDHIGKNNISNIQFIGMAVDFFRTYADRTHHGKEEDILFRELSKKKLSPKHRKIMEELAAEHVVARKTVKALIDARNRYVKGETYALDTIRKSLNELVNLYPEHIRKEDKDFFFPILDYFSAEEQAAMLREFNEFDRNMIHEKYENLISDLGGKVRKRPARR